MTFKGYCCVILLVSCAFLATGCAGVCGNGVIERNEECDDGNGIVGDGCDASCKIEPGWDCSYGECETVCGDGITAAAELCDPSDDLYGAYCAEDCQSWEGECGDGILQEQWEDCEGGLGCSGACKAEPGWSCSADVCQPICGDGRTVATEVCDPSDARSPYYCSSDCKTILGKCGDGIIQSSMGESCDDGNASNYDGCSDCKVDFGFTCGVQQPSSCIATGLDGSLRLDQLGSAEIQSFCSWLITTLGGAGAQYWCDGIQWTVNTTWQCTNALQSSGFGSDGACTIRGTESYAARLGSRCALMTTPRLCVR